MTEQFSFLSGHFSSSSEHSLREDLLGLGTAAGGAPLIPAPRLGGCSGLPEQPQEVQRVEILFCHQLHVEYKAQDAQCWICYVCVWGWGGEEETVREHLVMGMLYGANLLY